MLLTWLCRQFLCKFILLLHSSWTAYSFPFQFYILAIFSKKIWRTLVLFVGPLIPLFGLLMRSALSFKARVNCFIYMLSHLCAMKSSDSPLVQHLLISWWPTWQPSHSGPCTCEQALGSIVPMERENLGYSKFLKFNIQQKIKETK